ncbi:MAG: hypothetical protein IPO63_00760 [Bacteroidetes bacterium]|nr:hypothetical protein [Bacteroidota bacterium]
MKNYMNKLTNIIAEEIPPIKPEKSIPAKPDVNPDPTKPRPGVNEPEKSIPLGIDDPTKVDPTRIDDPTKTDPQKKLLNPIK